MMRSMLTEGAVETLVKGEKITTPVVLQLLNIMQVKNASAPTRFRLMMSDGMHSLSRIVLATQLNTLVHDNVLVPHCLCKMNKTVTSTLGGGKCVVIVTDMEVVMKAEDVGGKIGAPEPYNIDEKTDSPQKVVPKSPPSSSTGVPQKVVPKTSPSTSTDCPIPGPSHSCTASPPSCGRGRGFVNKDPMESPKKPQDSPVKVVHLAVLNPYQTKWTIRARVTSKSNIRSWNNSRGEGRLFSFDVVDESGEMKITAFNKEAERFFPLVEQGKVYYISKASLKLANKQYSTLKSDFEMTLNSNSSIVPCDSSLSIPIMHCDFVPIAELENKNVDAIVDVIGVCKTAEEVSRITTKTSREVSKRALHLMDTSGKVVTVTLWGEEAERFDGSNQPVVAVKGARLSDFRGRSLSALFSSTVMVNPDMPEACSLQDWYLKEGHALDCQSLTDAWPPGGGSRVNWKTLMDVTHERLGQGEKADYFSCVATVLYTRTENCLYRACPTANCSKKLVELETGLYHCEKCGQSFPNFKHRLLLSANIADFGGNQWVTCFQDTAEVLIGHSAETMGHLRDTDEDAFDEVFQKANFTTHIFKSRVKLETYNDESRVKATVVEIQSVDHREYSRRLIANIRNMAG